MKNPFRYFNSSPEVIRLTVMMYIRYPLSLRQVEDIVFERGIDICHETIRLWWNRFGPMFAAEIRKRRVHHASYSRWRWHLDEVFVRINGATHYLWRAVDHEGEVLEVLATKRRDRRAALEFLKRALKRYGQLKVIVTDRLRSYRAAMNVIGNGADQECGRWLNYRTENSCVDDPLPARAKLRSAQQSLALMCPARLRGHTHGPLALMGSVDQGLITPSRMEPQSFHQAYPDPSGRPTMPSRSIALASSSPGSDLQAARTGWYALPLDKTAHAMRASLLARATAATMRGRRARMPLTQGSALITFEQASAA